ncbi:MAG: GIY-YIG nuclease family protein [Solirubrobacterales bacterium]
MVEKDEILSEIRRLASENGGKPLGRGRFSEATGIREADWLGRYWARWSDAIEEAGLEPNAMQARTDDEEAIRRLALETRRLGHLPTYAEMRMQRLVDKGLPSNGVYERLGPKHVLAARLAAFCEENSGYADVLEMVLPHLVADDDIGEANSQSGERGFVYLLKSGRYYKIGHTNSTGRRAYELALQLPERATPIHEIATDDPRGIEAYWHRRFADRRRNGEWFELTTEDVSAFRRRKGFM